MAGPLEALIGYEPPPQQSALQSLMQQPPANPLTPMAGGLAGLLGLTDAYKALRGQMTDNEARDFAFGAALGVLPMGRGVKPLAKAIKPPAVYQTADGGSVTDYKSAFDFARRMAEDAGFEIRSASSQSPSLYLARPGSDKVLRVSDHPNRHPGRNAEVVEARLSPRRDEVVRKWHDPREGMIEEREFMNVIGHRPEEIADIIRKAIAQYDAK
jgi:hypothetical protein